MASYNVQLSTPQSHPKISNIWDAAPGEFDKCVTEGEDEGVLPSLESSDERVNPECSRNCLTMVVVWIDVTSALS